MKLLGLTSRYGGRVGVQIDYSGQLFFRGGPEPVANRLIVIELPGAAPLKFSEYGHYRGNRSLFGHVVRYLTKYKRGDDSEADAATSDDEAASDDDTARTRKKKRRPEISELPAELWRPAILDDFVDAVNAPGFIWQLHSQFPLSDFNAFAEKWTPQLQDRLRRALETPEGRERVAALEEIAPFVNRVQNVAGQMPGSLQQAILKAKQRIDRERLKQARREPDLTDARLIEIINKLETDAVRSIALNRLAREMARPPIDAARANALLALIVKKKKLREALDYAPKFWEAMGKVIRLEPTVTGETINIADAREETVTLGWEVLRAKRVGPVLPGRAALVLRDPRNYTPKYYIRGERKLKFKARRAENNRIEKYGCILTMAKPDEAQERMSNYLLDVERLDTLANVDPEAAVREIADAKNLPEDHLVFRVAEAAKTDARQARVLADLLIELHVGADADIMRSHARAQSRANRFG